MTPTEWKLYKLGDLITFQRGHDLPKERIIKGKYPVAGSNGIIGYHNSFTTTGPGITIGRSGNIGTPYYYASNFWAHNTTLYVKEFKGCNPKFIYYLLKTINFAGHNSGSAVPSLNRNYIHPIEILAPESEFEQSQIASILSSIEDKIELNLQINQTLEAIAQTIFKEWFVDFRFPGFDGELVEGLPKGWRIFDLGDVSTLFAGGDKPFNYSIKSDEQHKIPIYSNGITNEGLYGYTDKPRINEESVTVSARGTIGYVCLRVQPYLPIVRLIAVIPNQNLVSSKYLYFWLRNQNISGTGTTQQQLTVPDFSRSKVLIPKIEIVNKFTLFMDSFFQKINSNVSEIHTLTKLRDSLLPKLMTGKIKVV